MIPTELKGKRWSPSVFHFRSRGVNRLQLETNIKNPLYYIALLIIGHSILNSTNAQQWAAARKEFAHVTSRVCTPRTPEDFTARASARRVQRTFDCSAH